MRGGGEWVWLKYGGDKLVEGTNVRVRVCVSGGGGSVEWNGVWWGGGGMENGVWQRVWKGNYGGVKVRSGLTFAELAAKSSVKISYLQKKIINFCQKKNQFLVEIT